MQEPENIVDIVTSSLVAVIKQSLNASFRKECLHLLRAANNKDAEETIRWLFEKKMSKDSVKELSQQICPVSNIISAEKKMEEVQSSSTQKQQNEPISCAEHELEGCTASASVSTLPSNFPTTNSRPLNLNFKRESTQDLQIKKEDTKSKDMDSDEEIQLDWGAT